MSVYLLCARAYYSGFTSIHILCLHLRLQVLDYNVLYGAILDHVRSTGKEIEIPEGKYSQPFFPWFCFEAEDHSTSPPSMKDKYVMINTMVEDTRGLPNPTCSKQCPAINGGCCKCGQKGTYINSRKTSVYIGSAVQSLGSRYLHCFHDLVSTKY